MAMVVLPHVFLKLAIHAIFLFLISVVQFVEILTLFQVLRSVKIQITLMAMVAR